MVEVTGPGPSNQVDVVRRARRRRPSVVQTTFWWALTVLTLVVLDDLTFGPFFWAVSRFAGAAVAVGLIFAIYVPAQVYIVHRGMQPEPGRVAQFFLHRLDLTRRRPEIRARETQLHRRVAGGTSALLASLLIAGVLPPLLLWRAGYSRSFVSRISWATATVYAAEFALLHGFVPSLF